MICFFTDFCSGKTPTSTKLLLDLVSVLFNPSRAAESKEVIVEKRGHGRKNVFSFFSHTVRHSAVSFSPFSPLVVHFRLLSVSPRSSLSALDGRHLCHELSEDFSQQLDLKTQAEELETRLLSGDSETWLQL